MSARPTRRLRSLTRTVAVGSTAAAVAAFGVALAPVALADNAYPPPSTAVTTPAVGGATVSINPAAPSTVTSSPAGGSASAAVVVTSPAAPVECGCPPAGGSALAFTGATIVPLVIVGGGLVGGGVFLVIAGSRRRRAGSALPS